jgi:hypothetical protein
MATYYVKTSGNDASNGLTPATAWATIGKVFAASSVVTGGDTVYIAPGAYRELVTAAQTAWTSTVNIIGDPTSSLVSWGGIQPGKVRFTSLLSGDTANASSSVMFTASSRGYMAWQNINFEGLLNITSSGNTSFTKCAFVWATNTTVSNTPIVTMSFGTTSNYTFSKCIFASHATNNNGGLWITIDNGTDHNCNINDCLFSQGGFRIYGGVSTVANNINIFNCSFTGGSGGFYGINTGNGSRIATFTNCYFLGCDQAARATGTANILVQYSRAILCAIFTTNVSQSNNAVAGAIGVDIGENILFGLTAQPYLSSLQGYPNIAFGISSGAPVTDLYGITWTGATPDAGGITYQSLQLAGQYAPTERNASTITIAPGSTSQSIELYLGATGLTYATSGLAAYYVRNQSAPVAITLVTQTPTGAWTSGGFAEISSSLVPGVYRLDVPNAAFAAGASDVTIVVRGASGTNGAVLTVTLSSGGLTAAQTAAAVWDEPYTSHTTASTFGARTLKTVADNRLVNVGTAQHIEANVHAIVNSTAAANELEGALLHNGTDYVSADLLTPVSAATSVHIGPYQLLADGLGADQPLDVNVGTATSIDVQVTDANGTGIDITGATVTAKVYSSAGTLVATYSGTATYADNGRLTFGLTTTVTNTSGTYTVTVTRTTGATDTQIFGPLRLYVRPV